MIIVCFTKFVAIIYLNLISKAYLGYNKLDLPPESVA